MKVNSTAKKLQRAILQTGLIVKMSSSQFYSADQKRFITMFALSTPVYQYACGEWKTKDMQIIRTASGIELIECLREIWTAAKVWRKGGVL